MQGVRHFLIDELKPEEEFNIYIFKEKAKQYAEDIYRRGKIPIIAGGTGFYIQALLYDVDFTEEENDYRYRRSLEELAQKEGAAPLYEMLKNVDPESAAAIHPNNIKRVIRALEYYKITGEKISGHNETQRQRTSPYDFRYFVLNMDRALLYSRINQRVDLMMEKGLSEEVRKLRSMGYDRSLVSMQGIGYKEMFAYLDGECTLEQAVEEIKKNTRHFAKRQLTWFRREQDVRWVNYEEFAMDKNQILAYLIEECSARKALQE
jgi:tRNA dimethylallyltransferase